MRIKRAALILGLLFLLALILRLIAAHNVSIGPDEMVYSVYPYKFSTSGKLSTIEQAPVYFFMKDLAYRMFGYGLIPSRILSIIFGSLSVFLIFLIGTEIESKKSGYLAAFFFAASSYAVKYNYEMDPAMYFFGFLSLLFYVKWLKGTKWAVVTSAAMLACGMLVKPIIGLLAVPYVIFYLYWAKEGKSEIVAKRKDGFVLQVKKAKWVGIALLVSVLVVSPVLVYNYLYYNESGRTDYYFTHIFGIGENIYQGMGGQKPWTFYRFSSGFLEVIKRFFAYDPLIMVLALIGAVYVTRKKVPQIKKEWYSLLGLCILTITIYMSGRTGSPTHYVGLVGLFSLFAALGIVYALDELKRKKRLPAVLAGILAVQLVLMVPVFGYKAEIPQLMDIVKDVPDNAIIVAEPRIYHGISAYAFADKHYANFQDFSKIQQSNLTGEKITIPIYLLECTEGTCLWSTEDYANVLDISRQIIQQLTPDMKLVEKVMGKQYSINVYSGYLTTREGVYAAVDAEKAFFMAPIGWARPSVDSIEAKSTFDKGLYYLGMLMLYIDVLIAIASILLVYVLVRKSV